MSGSDLFTGTLDIMILRAVQEEAQHGYGIGQMLREVSRGVVDVAEGVMYPALHRLEKRGLLKAAWGESKTGRRAKYYSLTPSGERHLATQYAGWASFTAAVSAVLHMGPGPASNGQERRSQGTVNEPGVAVRND